LHRARCSLGLPRTSLHQGDQPDVDMERAVTGMAWVHKRVTRDGVSRYLAGYRDPTGVHRSAGVFTTHRDALRAATQAEVKVGEGAWLDPRAGRITFRHYVEQVW
jgi:hypothetical protein